MTRKDRDNYVLSSGRQIYANRGLISIAPPFLVEHGDRNNFAGFEIAEGYDGDISVGIPWIDDENTPAWEEWTQAERVELAEFMIAQWQAFKMAAESA